MVLVCVSLIISNIEKNIECLSMCIYWSFDLEKCLFKSFAHFLSQVVCGFFVIVESSMLLYSKLQIMGSFSENLKSSMFVVRTPV